MARPAKSAKVLTDKSQTKAEIDGRKAMEEKLRADGLPEPEQWLTDKQKDIFYYIVSMLKDTDILAGQDKWIIQTAAIAIDRLQQIEELINSNADYLTDSKLQSTRSAYTRDFFRTCNELCLSPQSRAKIAITAGQKEQMKPIEKVMKMAQGL